MAVGMDGIHDLGGMDGFGPVRVEPDEPVFHRSWEGRIIGMLFALSGSRLINTDGYRHAVERMDPAHYLAASYYERMMTGLATLLVEAGLTDRAELEARAGGAFPLARPVAPDPTLPVDAWPTFAVGDAVRVRNLHPRGHTRCPRYVRGRRGMVVRADPAFRLPDLSAHGVEAPRQPTYGVRFTARELWGDSGGEGESVCVDLWASYLEPA